MKLYFQKELSMSKRLVMYVFSFVFFSSNAFDDTFLMDFNESEIYSSEQALSPKELWQKIRVGSKDLVSRTLEKINFNVRGIYEASKSISNSLGKIENNVSSLQRQVRRPDGPVNVIGNIIKVVEDLEARISDISIEKERKMGVILKSPTLIYNYFKLIKQIDSLKLNDLLIPVNSIMH